jgi:hypothetical protein
MISIAISEGTARDLIAPSWSAANHPVEVRRQEAQEEVAELARVALAEPVVAHTMRYLKAIASNVEGHIGHRVTVTTNSGVVTAARCEDCNVDIEVPE